MEHNVDKEFIDYTQNCIETLGIPSSFSNESIMKDWFHSLMHYMALDRIKKNPELINDVRSVFNRLQEMGRYSSYFSSEWSKILNDLSTLEESYKRTDYWDQLRISSPVIKSDIFTDDERKFLITKMYEMRRKYENDVSAINFPH